MSATISSTGEENIEVIDNNFNETRNISYGIVRKLKLSTIDYSSKITKMEKCPLVITATECHASGNYHVCGGNQFKVLERI